MTKKGHFKDVRLLEALDYIDRDLVGEVAVKLRFDDASSLTEEPVITWRTPFKHWKSLAALAACILLLSIASPLVSYIAEVISNFNAGAGSGTTEELNTEYTEPIETNQALTTESIETEQPINTTSEETRMPFQYVVSREEFDEMTAAWKIFRNNQKHYIVPEYKWFTYWYPCSGGACVYKKEADVIVFCIHNNELWYVEMTVAGYLFKLPSREEIWVYKDKDFYSLNKAYELGILDEEDIKELSEIHHEHLYGENRFG
jgi:hypothetical protein